MSYCINPVCPAPAKNSLTTNFCISCGKKILLKDRYRAEKLLGQGGFGKTFQALDEDQPRKPLCVIKQFSFSSNNPKTRATALKLFYEEAQHLEALGKHDQIPELLAYFDVEGEPYLVQQFIDGQDLEQELKTSGTFNQTQIRELLGSLLPVLDFLHNQSIPIIHRDIKPANIIRRKIDRQLILVDFGAAKQATQTMLAQTGTVIGSPEYTAIEQARGKPVFASDIYSLGVTCIHLLTQISPFDLFDMNRDTWVWREYLVDNPVDEKLGKVLDKMIVNSLPQRYGSASKVLTALSDRQNTAPLIYPIDKPQQNLNQVKNLANLINKHPQLQLFKFETATLTIGTGFWGGTKANIKKSSGTAYQFVENLGNKLPLEMVGIPAGIFLMGAPNLEEGSSDYQRPQHRVRVASFYLGKYPITQAQYQAVMGNNPAYFQSEDSPVETVSWYDAVEFCKKLSQRTGKQYRLPSESEWEYACRGRTTTAFHFGETISPEVVNYQTEQITPVGSFPANNYGLYDMHGNIMEWCADKYHDSYLGAPTDGSAWSNDRKPAYVLRGGCWYSKSSYCRSAARSNYTPDHRSPYFGFRVVCTLPPVSK
jgi:formylglycine-generating enzyme required for sulfatase activity